MNTDTEVTKINYAANLDELTKQINIKNININLSNRENLILCDMYNYLLKSVFNKDISYNKISKSLSTFKQTQLKQNKS